MSMATGSTNEYMARREAQRLRHALIEAAYEIETAMAVAGMGAPERAIELLARLVVYMRSELAK